MNLQELQVGVIIPFKEDWIYRDSYNQVWILRRRTDPFIPIIIELHEKLTHAITDFEKIIRKSK